MCACDIFQNNPSRQTFREYPDVLNIGQMSEILGVSTKTGYKLLREGKIACMKVGRSYCIPKDHVLTFLKINNHS